MRDLAAFLSFTPPGSQPGGFHFQRFRYGASTRAAMREHFQVYSGEVRIGTIYRTHQHPGGNEWMWFLNGVQNGPGPFNGFVRTFEDAKADF
jgi:hypothetical protein